MRFNCWARRDGPVRSSARRGKAAEEGTKDAAARVSLRRRRDPALRCRLSGLRRSHQEAAGPQGADRSLRRSGPWQQGVTRGGHQDCATRRHRRLLDSFCRRTSRPIGEAQLALEASAVAGAVAGTKISSTATGASQRQEDSGTDLQGNRWPPLRGFEERARRDRYTGPSHKN